jgi:hypothetical protein
MAARAEDRIGRRSRYPVPSVWRGRNGRQTGDPAKLADALLTIAADERPPRHFIAGAAAIETAEQRVAGLRQQIDAFRDLSTSLSYDPVAMEIR